MQQHLEGAGIEQALFLNHSPPESQPGRSVPEAVRRELEDGEARRLAIIDRLLPGAPPAFVVSGTPDGTGFDHFLYEVLARGETPDAGGARVVAFRQRTARGELEKRFLLPPEGHTIRIEVTLRNGFF